MAKAKQAKQFLRPPKKQKAKAAAPETTDEFQEAADLEEEAGGKHRVGDSLKSARAFLRALDLYDQGLKKHPSNFDLVYNKARLLLEITQQPELVEHVGLPKMELLQQTLTAHKYALKLNKESPDVLFNTSQVLTTLAESLSELSETDQAIVFLQEALELLSACLSRQEMLLEQQQMDFEDAEEGGVQLDPEEKPASTTSSEPSEQSALVETPLTPNDLLDTVHASLSALTTMIPLVEPTALQTYADMAHALTEKKSYSYVMLLPEDARLIARFSLALDRAIFIAAFADAQFNAYMIELETYVARLQSFDNDGEYASARALEAEAEARTELVLSALDRNEQDFSAVAETCWKELGIAQDLYTRATKLETPDAAERKAGLYRSKGNVELLRHRLASSDEPNPLSKAIRGSIATLLSNAQTYYKGAAQIAMTQSSHEHALKSQQRWLISAGIAKATLGIEAKAPPFDPKTAKGDLMAELEACVDEGFISMPVGEAVVKELSSGAF